MQEHASLKNVLRQLKAKVQYELIELSPSQGSDSYFRLTRSVSPF